MAGKPTRMSLVTEEEQARYRSIAKMIMLCESLERAHSPERFSSNHHTPGRLRSSGGATASPTSMFGSVSGGSGASNAALSPSKRRFRQAMDFASTGSHVVDLMKVNEPQDYRTTITKEKNYIERFFDSWRGGRPNMIKFSDIDRQRVHRRSPSPSNKIAAV